MAPKKKFQARVEVYFIIYIATIVSFFAIEGEVTHFKKNQKAILLEVSKEKIQNLVQIQNASDIHSRDTIDLQVRLRGAFDKSSFEGSVLLSPIDVPDGMSLPELEYPLLAMNDDPEDKSFRTFIPKEDFDLNAEVLYGITANINVMPDEHEVEEELSKSYEDHMIVKKIMEAVQEVGEISLQKRFQNPLDPAGGAVQAPFTMTVDRPKVSIVEGLPWEVRVIIGGVADASDLAIETVRGGSYIGKLVEGTPVTIVSGRGRKDGRIELIGSRLSDEMQTSVVFDLQVRPPVWVKRPTQTEAYVGDPLEFEGALRDIPSSETSIRIGGTAVKAGTVPGTTVSLSELAEAGQVDFQVLVDGREVRGMAHTIQVIPPPPPKISANPVGRDGNFLVFEIETYGVNNGIKRFRRKGGVGSNRQMGEPQVLGGRKVYRWEVEIERPYDDAESMEIKFAILDDQGQQSEYKKIFIYNY